MGSEELSDPGEHSQNYGEALDDFSDVHFQDEALGRRINAALKDGKALESASSGRAEWEQRVTRMDHNLAALYRACTP